MIVNTSRGPCCASAQLAIASSQTGALRLGPQPLHHRPGCRLGAVAPGARQLPADAGNGSYIVDVATLSARPLFFVHSRDPKIQDSQDVNYSALVIAQPQANVSHGRSPPATQIWRRRLSRSARRRPRR